MATGVIDPRGRNLKAAQVIAVVLVFPLWAGVALAAWRNYAPLAGVIPFRPLLILAIICTVVIFAAGYLGQLLDYLEDRELGEAIKGRGGEVNSYALAAQYVGKYHSDKRHPFDRDEEQRLINFLMERFGLFEETAAEIVAANWPLHRSGLPYRGGGDNAATRREGA